MKIRRDFLPLLECLLATAIISAAKPLPGRADVPLDDHQHMPLINMGSGKCFEPRSDRAPSTSSLT
jgi:hypothetical protein